VGRIVDEASWHLVMGIHKATQVSEVPLSSPLTPGASSPFVARNPHTILGLLSRQDITHGPNGYGKVRYVPSRLIIFVQKKLFF
jgi:hypothetical protein